MTDLAPIPMAHRDQTAGFGKGWYCVVDAQDLKDGEILPVSYFDRELVVYRDSTGVAHVADAYCPHLGAHLASHDGCIENGEVVCPFHKWRFDAVTGECSSIPYSRAIPPRARLSEYPVHETSGIILIWWDETGGAPGPLPFDQLAAYGDLPWIKVQDYMLETRVPQRDLWENLFDSAHIHTLHNSGDMPKVSGVERRDYGMEVNYEQLISDYGVTIRKMQFAFSGMGTMSQVILGDGIGFVQTNSATPIDRERIRLQIRMYVMDTGNDAMNKMAGIAMAERVANEIQQDMAVLNYKKHLPQPLICGGDGPIMKWREYAAELYEPA